ncbi:hypothetical protein AAF143_16430 [Cyanobium sp. ATX-6F1]
MDPLRSRVLNARARLGRRHRFFLQLFLVCVLLMVSYTLPQPLRHLSTVGQVLMVVLLIKHLGEPITFPATSRVSDCLYRALGVLALMAQATWFLTPLSFAKTGMPLLVLWSLFVTWSTLRLVHLLGQETVVNGQVLMGAAAGYLMLGLTAGLLLSVLETVHPGSFTSVHNEGGQLLVPRLRGAGAGAGLGARLRAAQLLRLRQPHHRGLRRHPAGDAGGPDRQRQLQRDRPFLSGGGDGAADQPLHDPGSQPGEGQSIRGWRALALRARDSRADQAPAG